MMPHRYSKTILLFLVWLTACLLSLKFGSLTLNLLKINSPTLQAIFELRLSRVIIASLAGSSLALTGLLYQTVLQNPLAEPYLLGVSAGGALGAVSALFWGSGSPFLAAISGSLLALLVVFLFAQKQGSFDNTGLILSGVMVNAFCSAIIMLLVILAGSKVNSIMFWMMGDIGSAELKQSIFILPLLLFLALVVFIFSNSLDTLSLGEEQAESLGVDVQKIKIFVFVFSSLLTGLVVAVTGIIGFVGLVIPHISKMIFGEKIRNNILPVLIIGAGFTTFADLLARIIIPDSVLPIGILTAVIGVPFFISIFKRTN